MLTRLLLAILLAAFAGPSMAAGSCHDSGGVRATMAMGAMPAMPGRHDHGSAADHRCIGCMPLPDSVASRSAVRLAPAPRPRPVPTRFDLRAGGPPAAPPPRIG